MGNKSVEHLENARDQKDTSYFSRQIRLLWTEDGGWTEAEWVLYARLITRRIPVAEMATKANKTDYWS